ncbi:MAG TPA: PIN domain-containing protein [Candidatus Saccharimonadales bacterium]|nr:PIN domain-containing protein [Candidatus Saccharimonadales bacterium]
MQGAVVDTNILIRIATGDIPKQARAASQLIRTYGPGGIILPEAVLAEAVFVLNSKQNYNLSRAQVRDCLKEILGLEQLSCDRTILDPALKFFATTKLDFVDCLALAYVKAGRAQKLLSFDTELLSANHK